MFCCKVVLFCCMFCCVIKVWCLFWMMVIVVEVVVEFCVVLVMVSLLFFIAEFIIWFVMIGTLIIVMFFIFLLLLFFIERCMRMFWIKELKFDGFFFFCSVYVSWLFWRWFGGIVYEVWLKWGNDGGVCFIFRFWVRGFFCLYGVFIEAFGSWCFVKCFFILFGRVVW